MHRAGYDYENNKHVLLLSVANGPKKDTDLVVAHTRCRFRY
jgi:hypothetical protein